MPRYGCAECLTAWSAHDHSGRPERCPECGTGEVFVDKPHGEPVDLYDRVSRRLTADGTTDALSISISGASITASAPSRTLAGPLVQYGVYGRTSRGRLKVAPGALRFPDDLSRVKLTKEHDRAASRGHLTGLEHSPEGIRASTRVSDGAEGDAALVEAADHTRDAFSFDVIDATIAGDTITDALVIAIGQVGIPAYDDARIDTIAASNNTGEEMTKEQRARLAWLRALDTRTADQEADLATLVELDKANPEPVQAAAPAAAPAAPATGTEQVAASMPAVPGSTLTPVAVVKEPKGAALQAFYENICAAMAPENRASKVADITAALQDITNTAQSVIEQPAWSGELWSGQLYEPQFSDLFNTGDLTSWSGIGWRFTSKLEIQDYAGDKAAIPSDNVSTESSNYTAARMAVGVDIDRKFFDFPNTGFIQSLFEQIRESWAMQLDAKIKAYMLANAVKGTRTAVVSTTNADATVTAAAGTFSSDDVGAAITGTGIPASTTILSVTNSGSIELSANATATGTPTATIDLRSAKLLKAAALAVRALKRRKVGKASFVYLNDDDLFDLMDIAEKDVSAFLELFDIDPKNFRSSLDIPAGSVLAGVKQAATVRTLPGSPIRVDAQNLANGGVDEAAFGYWAIEEHHTSGIAVVTYAPAA